MMRSKIVFWQNKLFEPAGLEDNLMTRKRSFRHEIGVMWKTLGVMEGYWSWLFINIFTGMTFSTLMLSVPWLERVIFDEVIPTRDLHTFWIIAGIYVLVEIQNNLLGHIQDVLGHFTNMRMGMWVQAQYYRHLQKVSLTFLERKGIGEHMYRMSSDLYGVVGFAGGFLPTFFRNTWDLLLTFVFIGFLDWRLSLIVVGYEIFYIFAAHVLGTWSRKIEFYARGAKERADARLQEGLHGVATVKVFGRRKAEVGGYIGRVAMQMRVEVLAQFLTLIRNTFFRGNGFFPYFKDFVILNILYFQVIQGEMSYGTVFPVLAFLKLLGRPVERLVDLWNSMRFRMAWLERAYQYWDIPEAVKDKPGAKKPGKLRGRLQVEKVDFEYENGVKVLDRVSLEVEPGSFSALVGASGSGKSTLLSLVMRLHDPTAGRILMDGTDIRDFKVNEYQKQLGIVLQETFVSKETLLWNLKLANFDATEEDMLKALEQCNLRHWFEGLPEGFQSTLAEGTRLSTGERQRLGIARALLRKSNLFLLDEPTSSLDLETEAEVMDVIHQVRRGKTTLMVTHRLNTITAADRIFVMDQGRLVETGTHRELLARRGKYHELVSLFSAGASGGGAAPEAAGSADGPDPAGKPA